MASYRCHCIALMRGSTVEQVFAEMFGFSTGNDFVVFLCFLTLTVIFERTKY
jgi:TPP-dependent pyruvate/acetoin dehydrogenase alpha subunit